MKVKQNFTFLRRYFKKYNSNSQEYNTLLELAFKVGKDERKYFITCYNKINQSYFQIPEYIKYRLATKLLETALSDLMLIELNSVNQSLESIANELKNKQIVPELKQNPLTHIGTENKH